jgi:hypothetical protein
MAASSTDRQRFREIARSKFEDATQACVAKAHAMSLGQPSINLILAGELIRLGAAFAIRLGANEDGVASLARGCYAEAQALVRSPPSGLF